MAEPKKKPEFTPPAGSKMFKPIIVAGEKAYRAGYVDGWKAGWRAGLCQYAHPKRGRKTRMQRAAKGSRRTASRKARGR